MDTDQLLPVRKEGLDHDDLDARGDARHAVVIGEQRTGHRDHATLARAFADGIRDQGSASGSDSSRP